MNLLTAEKVIRKLLDAGCPGDTASVDGQHKYVPVTEHPNMRRDGTIGRNTERSTLSIRHLENQIRKD